MEFRPHGACRQQEAKPKRLGKALVRRFATDYTDVIDAGLVPVYNQVAVLVDHRRAPTLSRVVGVDEDTATQVRRAGVHSRYRRREFTAVENAQADIRFQDSANIDDGLIAQS